MSNKARCEACKTVIQSTSRHDFVPCACGAIFVDGGDDYFRCGYDKPENFTTIYPDGREENMVESIAEYNKEVQAKETAKEKDTYKETNQLIDEIIEKLRELKR